MPRYIVYPVDTNPENVIQDVISLLQLRFPGWQPIDAALDTVLIEAFSSSGADIRDLASQVTDAIYRDFGFSLLGVQPVDATDATVHTTWTLTDTLGHTIPAGTQVGVRNSAGDLLPFTVVSDVVVAPGAAVTASGGVTLQAVTAGASGTGLGGVGAPCELIDPLVFVSSIVCTGTSSGGMDAETDDDYVDRLRTYLTLLTPTPVVPDDFALLARQVAGVWRAAAIDGFNPLHNLLTANEASAETDASGWASLANTTVASEGAQAADGTKSVKMTAASGADMSIVTVAAKTVTPGETLTAIASFKTAVTARNVKVGIQWRDAAHAQISISYGSTVADASGAFGQAFVTAVAPELAAEARVVCFVTSPANAEVHYVDKMSLRRGSTTDWVIGGSSDTGNARTITVISLDSDGSGISSGIKSDVDVYLQGRREVNFLIYEADPTLVNINVTTTVKALAGFDTATVQASVVAAITAYLNKATWGTDQGDSHSWENVTKVRYLEMANVINGVQGVDYITTTGSNFDLTQAINGFTMSRADINLPGLAPLPVANTITVTVT